MFLLGDVANPGVRRCGVEDVMAVLRSVLDAIGNTPVVELRAVTPPGAGARAG